MAVVSIKNKLRRGNLLVGNDTFIPTSFESIATIEVGAGGAANVEFTSIPSTYKHLQIRTLMKVDTGTPDLRMNFNNDTAANYKFHLLNGDGGTAISEVYTGSTIQNPSNYFLASIIDILDYTSTTKNKTSRVLKGKDNNGSGDVGLWSHLWFATPAAITSIKFTLSTATNISQYSHFALYGIKGA